MTDIAICYVNFKRKKDILQSLATLVADLADSKYTARITIADNSGNTDGIKEAVAAQFPMVEYIDCGGNIGFGKANNKGFQKQDARYYFALNPDTEFIADGNTINQIIKFMDAHKKIGAIGPKLLNMDGSLQYACYRFDLPSMLIKPLRQMKLDNRYNWVRKRTDRLLMKDFDHDKTMPVDWVLGAALIVRKEVVDEVGWFDDKYFMYLEDADWCHRMWEAGWPVYYVHDIVIRHRHGRESAKVPGVLKALFKNKLARIHLKSWIYYLWKWRGNHKYYGKLS